jgi:hypothetical protein
LCFLPLHFQIGVGHHHQLHMTFHRKEVSHLVIAPTERLLGDAVEILDFPPSQVVADNGLGRGRICPSGHYGFRHD